MQGSSSVRAFFLSRKIPTRHCPVHTAPIRAVLFYSIWNNKRQLGTDSGVRRIAGVEMAVDVDTAQESDQAKLLRTASTYRCKVRCVVSMMSSKPLAHVFSTEGACVLGSMALRSVVRVDTTHLLGVPGRWSV
jgi:hypothetical protein